MIDGGHHARHRPAPQGRLALILWPGVQYRSGEAHDPSEIVHLGHAAGAVVGFDLAHGIGNLPLRLHDANADFAVWCSYKYLNSGPGAIAGCFVHERHARTDRPRFAGWWGHDQASRFKMGPDFQPTPGADGWQLSNPPILALAPLRVSLEIFQRADIAAFLGMATPAILGSLQCMQLAKNLADLQRNEEAALVANRISGACNGTNIACSDATTMVASGLTVGETYYLRIYHYFNAAPSTPALRSACWCGSFRMRCERGHAHGRRNTGLSGGRLCGDQRYA